MSLFLHFRCYNAELELSCNTLRRLPLDLWTLKCWVLRQSTNSIVSGRKGHISQTQATCIKSSYCLFTLLCHTRCIHQAAIFNSVYLCSVSTPKGHTKLHWKWYILQAEQCAFGGISTLGWHLESGKKRKKGSKRRSLNLMYQRGEWRCKLVTWLLWSWFNEMIRTSITAHTI